MSDNAFDELARAAATTTSRRGALKLLGGGVLAALAAGVFGARGAQAANCLPIASSCSETKECCDGKKKSNAHTKKIETCCCDFPKAGPVCTPHELCTPLGGVCLP